MGLGSFLESGIVDGRRVDGMTSIHLLVVS
jgi:hypothetical protein